MSIGGLFVILISAMLVNNFVLSRFLGICPFLGVSKQVETAFGMGMAVTFVMTLSSIITYIVYHTILVRLEIEFLQTLAFILIIASLVQLVEMFIQKMSPTLYQALGVYLPLITTNCAVLGLAIINIQEDYNLIETIVHSLGASIGFSLAIVLFAGIRERLALADVPESLKGFPIALITAGLMSIAFLGFTGLV
ncbi:electron transport complex protein RnfA [Caloranaerobacter azorensis DSM 13643]|uniref:Ion-translocating oxidoreductase complex subunit A n=1 Tax=Caloranaerobacter azorensis DSM 13643 TaxID=1121264 RepID=A0A1M5UDK5_9FIRM|nr:electron transport complex subunit RsxA [Caloranaerobacter azorensis]SHH61037.1 electron transport complex protein RnfA [Caloranaerobacter azorensis DSM 13643]